MASLQKSPNLFFNYKSMFWEMLILFVEMTHLHITSASAVLYRY